MKNNDQGKYYVFALRAATDITITIAAPAVIAAVAGSYLDTRFVTGRLFFVLFLITSAVLVVWGIVTKVQRYGTAFKKLVDEPRDGTPRS